MRILAVLVVLISLFGSADAQQPSITASPVNSPITVDGILNESVWEQSPLLNFIQQSPSNGMQPTEETMAWVAYDDEALYIAAWLFDSAAPAITRNISGRDVDVPSDWFEVSLDPSHDGRTGYYFRVTAAAGRIDGTISDETSRSSAWDGNWQCATTIDSLGWYAELRIPFSQLRFPHQDHQIWGINLTRWIYRKREEIVLSPAPSSIGQSTAYFATLRGLDHLTPQTRFELRPYAVSQLHLYESDPSDPLNRGDDYTLDAGADALLGLGSGLTLNATINPDFGQVEVDPASINLSVYETIYQEKRPFFTEGSELFSFGDGSVGEFFYSRRIGRAPQGEVPGSGYKQIPRQTRILGAAKLTGTIDDGNSLGILAAVTARTYAGVVDSVGVRRKEIEIEPPALYGAVRDLQQFDGGRRGIGIFGAGVLRDIHSQAIAENMNNGALAAGVDSWAYLDSGRVWYIRGLAGGSYVEGSQRQLLRLQRAPQRYFQRPDAPHLQLDSAATSLYGWTGRLSLAKRQGNLTGDLTLYSTSPGFELNDIGILHNADKTGGSLTVNYAWYEPDDIFLTRSIAVSASRQLDYSGSVLQSNITMYADAEFANAWGGSLSGTYSPAGINVKGTRGGPSIVSPARWSGSASMYSDDIGGLTFWSSADGSVDRGDGRSYGVGGGITWRPVATFMVSAGPWWESGDWPASFFSTVRDSLMTATFGTRYIFARMKQTSFSSDFRISWSATPRLSLQIYAQYYDNRTRYSSFRELLLPASFAFHPYDASPATIAEQNGTYSVDPDGDGPAATFPLYNSDFDYASLRGTAVLQWEYLPGSTLYLVWTRSYFAYDDFWTQQPDSQLHRLLTAHPDDTVLLKVSYLLGG
jgi:hypothetical protein